MRLSLVTRKRRPALSASRPVALAERIERAPVLDRPVRALSDAVVEGQVPPGDAEAARRWLLDHRELLDGP